MGNYFEIHYNAVKYPIDSEKSRGLRNAQLGAIHAISSFFTLNKKEAAIVIMPTGSGKTAVLMLTPYLIRKQRVLVVTPSKMVRGQIAEDFSELRTLCVANVFNTSIKNLKFLNWSICIPRSIKKTWSKQMLLLLHLVVHSV